jgi:hypothetical protein
MTSDCNQIGSIIGWSSLRCACCEGWIIEFNGDSLLADSIPNSKEIIGSIDNATFPIPIKFGYIKPKFCSKMRIIITCVEKR